MLISCIEVSEMVFSRAQLNCHRRWYCWRCALKVTDCCYGSLTDLHLVQEHNRDLLDLGHFDGRLLSE